MTTQALATTISVIFSITLAVAAMSVMIWLRYRQEPKVLENPISNNADGAKSAVTKTTTILKPKHSFLLSDSIFFVIVVALNYGVYNMQFLKPLTFWFVVALQLGFFWSKARRPFNLAAGFGLLLLGGIYFEGGLGNGLNWLDRGINHGKWPKPTTQTNSSAIDQPIMIMARASGQIIAPVGKWSDWLSFPEEDCVHWWTDEPNKDDIYSRFLDRTTGEMWSGSSKNHIVKARSWKSKFNDRPVRVSYQLLPLASNGVCPTF